VGTAIVLGHHVDIVVIPPAIRLLVLDANVWKMHLVIEVREVALKRPLPDLLVGPIRVAVVIGTAALEMHPRLPACATRSRAACTHDRDPAPAPAQSHAAGSGDA
jgi:hypothetical protein